MTPEEKVALGIVGALGVIGLALLATRGNAAAAPTTIGTAPPQPKPPPPSPLPAKGCLAQAPQPFLIRQNYRQTPGGLDAAIAYRTETYGYVPGFGDPAQNPMAPKDDSVTTTVFGLPVVLHRKVIPSLRCVESEILAVCGTAYQPQILSGLRLKNTYQDGEVSNHMYGIALDVDPLKNPCCGCTGQWANAPQCKKVVTTEFERMAMPECWVHVFEKYGWYWLGHDTLRDTMHFEFLGVPPPLAGDDALAVVVDDLKPSSGDRFPALDVVNVRRVRNHRCDLAWAALLLFIDEPDQRFSFLDVHLAVVPPAPIALHEHAAWHDASAQT